MEKIFLWMIKIALYKIIFFFYVIVKLDLKIFRHLGFPNRYRPKGHYTYRKKKFIYNKFQKKIIFVKNIYFVKIICFVKILL